jgi:hypothetical protein
LAILVTRTSIVSGGAETFDYYIGPSGSDSNDGLTTGTPWAITAVWTKAATYKTKRLGVLDGTYAPYNGSIDALTNDVALLIPSTAVGTSISRTVIQSVNPRGAIIVGTGGFVSTNIAADVVVEIAANYVTFAGFDVRAGGLKGVQVLAADSIVENCAIHDINSATYALSHGNGDNVSGVRTDTGGDRATIRNNKIYNIRNGTGGLTGGTRSPNESGIELYNSADSVVQYNDVSDVSSLVYIKDDANDCDVNKNYLHGSAYEALRYGTNNAFPYKFRNNVVAGITGMVYNGESNNVEVTYGEQYNNTYIFSVTARGGVLYRATTGTPAKSYNNLFMRTTGTVAGTDSYYDMNGSAGAFAILDYNLYGASSQFTSPNGTLKTYATWKTAMAGNGVTARETSSINADATFAAGSNAAAYKLDPSSRGYQEGKTGGIAAGGACNIGAYESPGQTEQIGTDW